MEECDNKWESLQQLRKGPRTKVNLDNTSRVEEEHSRDAVNAVDDGRVTSAVPKELID